jgi:hypothetical protein
LHADAGFMFNRTQDTGIDMCKISTLDDINVQALHVSLYYIRYVVCSESARLYSSAARAIITARVLGRRRLRAHLLRVVRQVCQLGTIAIQCCRLDQHRDRSAGAQAEHAVAKNCRIILVLACISRIKTTYHAADSQSRPSAT